MATGKFIADPGRIRRGGEMMEELPQRTNKIADDFISDMQNYRGWAGYNDDFALEVLPKYDATNESCLELIRTVGTALADLGRRSGPTGSIEGVSSYANEQIGRQMSSLDGPGGDSAGGGRH